jgi:hypothetical protein
MANAYADSVAKGSDIRFSVPLYTSAEAARCLDVPDTTFRTWVKEGLVASLPAGSLSANEVHSQFGRGTTHPG